MCPAAAPVSRSDLVHKGSCQIFHPTFYDHLKIGIPCGRNVVMNCTVFLLRFRDIFEHGSFFDLFHGLRRYFQIVGRAYIGKPSQVIIYPAISPGPAIVYLIILLRLLAGSQENPDIFCVVILCLFIHVHDLLHVENAKDELILSHALTYHVFGCFFYEPRSYLALSFVLRHIAALFAHAGLIVRRPDNMLCRSLKRIL